MKIIKNGKRNCGAFKFKCDKCGCKFEADASDYIYVNKSFDFDIDKFIHKPTENNTPSDTAECECPNCGNKVIKNIYKNKGVDNPLRNLFAVMAITNAASVILILCAMPKKAEGMSGFQIFVEVLLIILALINSIIHSVGWAEELY